MTSRRSDCLSMPANGVTTARVLGVALTGRGGDDAPSDSTGFALYRSRLRPATVRQKLYGS